VHCFRMQLYDRTGRRLYLTAEERAAFLKAARTAPREVRTLCQLIHDTGIRESEALEITPERVDLSGGCVIVRTLKKRSGKLHHRAIPVPPATLDQLDLVHGIRDAHRKGPTASTAPLWPWSRSTVWRRISEVMKAADIPSGPHRCPKGLRHSFGVHAILSGVPLNMLCKWMGHATMETTAIYANALGAEEQGIAARMWGG
jgi:integrase/recombinase XerD